MIDKRMDKLLTHFLTINKFIKILTNKKNKCFKIQKLCYNIYVIFLSVTAPSPSGKASDSDSDIRKFESCWGNHLK